MRVILNFIKENFPKMLYYCFVLSFVGVMTFTLALMFISPTGMVSVVEPNILIRTSEIGMGVFLVIYTLKLIKSDLLDNATKAVTEVEI